MYVNIAVLKETSPGEKRVALVPSIVPGLMKLGGRLHMQTGAGDAVGLTDDDFADVTIVPDSGKLVAEADVVLCVQPPALSVVGAMKPGAVLICYVYAASQPALIKHLIARQITCLAIERLPRITRAQSMDALSSQAALAGYSAVMLGAATLARVLPKVTTAAGTIGPAKVLVMGLGVAGLEALATAHRLGAVT
ncbi:MAG: NAD(P)(+) transhydrogenase (Re/Si-specific) subunit alpha, partial [bacterium]